MLAKVGLDGHDRGVDAAVQEDVDVLGVSLLSGAHMTIFPRILKRLAERGIDDILLIGGGVMPDEDVAALKRMGVAEILLQDTPPETIVTTVRRLVQERGPR
jgi:methylmalonyl-CoA mutase C-terminal domain/subunit